MSWGKAGVLAALSCLIILSSYDLALGEVRLRSADGQAELQVQFTPRGVWSPVGQVEATVLNPSGDLFGDGHPGHATCDGSVTAAWFRPATQQLLIANGTEHGWLVRAQRPAVAAVGMPRVSCSTQRTLVTWTAVAAGQPSVVIEWLGEGRLAEQPDAVLIDSAVSGDAAAVLLGEALGNGGLVVTMGTLNPPGVPIDIRRSHLVDLPDLSLASRVRAFPAEDLGLESGRVFITVPEGAEGQLRVLTLDEQGVLTEEGSIRVPRAGSDAAMLAKLRKAVRR